MKIPKAKAKRKPVRVATVKASPRSKKTVVTRVTKKTAPKARAKPKPKPAFAAFPRPVARKDVRKKAPRKAVSARKPTSRFGVGTSSP